MAFRGQTLYIFHCGEKRDLRANRRTFRTLASQLGSDPGHDPFGRAPAERQRSWAKTRKVGRPTGSSENSGFTHPSSSPRWW
jgi:hypothetical protein